MEVVAGHRNNPNASWEQWFVNKELQLRNVKRTKLAEKQLVLNEKKQKVIELQRRKQQGLAAHEKWLEYKNGLLKQHSDAERKKTEKLNKESETRELTKREKSAAVFEEWVKMKKQENIDKQKHELEIKQKLEEEALEKRRKNEECYESWLKSTKSRKFQSHLSFAYNDGKLIGYYDRARNPRPSFCNSEPWHPPDDVQPASPYDNCPSSVRTHNHIRDGSRRPTWKREGERKFLKSSPVS